MKVNEEPNYGSLFVVEVRLRHFRFVLSFGQKGTAAGGKLSSPWAVAVNECDEIAVTDSGNCKITKWYNIGITGDKQG